MHPCFAVPDAGVESAHETEADSEPADRHCRSLDIETPAGRRLLAVADPLPGAAACPELIADALAAFAVAFREADGLELEQAAAQAFAHANAVLWAANRARSVGDPRRRTCIGLTAICAEGPHLLLAVVPPGQALLVQDGELMAFPTLAAWEGQGLGDAPGCAPLGFRERVRPRFARSIADPRDLVMLGSATIGRAAVAAGEQVRVAALGNEPVAASTQTIECALAEFGLSAAAICLKLGDLLPAPALAARTVPRSTAAPAPFDAYAPDVTSRRHGVGAGRERVHARLVELSERLLPRRRDTSLPMEGKRRAVAPPGAGSLRRYHTQPRPVRFLRLRTRLPRMPRVGVSRRLAALFLALTLLVGGAGFGYDVRQTRAARQDHSLAKARGEIAAATAAEGIAGADAHLVNAESWLSDAVDHGTTASDLNIARRDIASARDRIHGVERLTQLRLVGALPAEFDASDAHLLLAGGRLYLLGDAVYEVDPNGRRLTPVLVPGDGVDGRIAAAPAHAADDGGILVVSDGSTLFRRARSGDWSAKALARRESGGPWIGTSGGGYRGGFYLLGTGTGQILKFAAGDVGVEPTPWVRPETTAELSGAIDMVVDGGIVILSGDGHLERLYQGAPAAREEINLDAAGAAPVALAADSSSPVLSVLIHDDRAGRIIQFDADLQRLRILLAPEWNQAGQDERGGEALRLASDVAVDNAAGVVYLLTPSGVWSASFAAAGEQPR